MDRGVLAAIKLLPRHKKEIQELALLDEEFRSICTDLADAEAALQRHAKSTFPDSSERYAEYQHLVDDLELELRQAIKESQIEKK